MLNCYVKLEPGELVGAFRVGKKARGGNSQHGQGSAVTHSFIITLKNKDSCKKLVAAKKNKPNLTAKDVDVSFSNNKVYLNAHQPAQLYQLRDRVLKAFPRVERKHVWIADGAVFMRKSADSRPIRILPSTDLQELSQYLFESLTSSVLNSNADLPVHKICSLNAQSLMAHFREFRDFFRLNPKHVIGVVESWLCDDIADQQVNLSGYINSLKTKAMFFCSGYNINSLNLDDIPRLLIAGENIEYVDSFKYLGVILEPTLLLTDQVTKVCSSASRTLYRIRQSTNCLNTALKRQLIISLVLPIFDYCAIALTNLSLSLEKKLAVALNNCIRFVLRRPLGAHINDPRLELGWLSPQNRRLYLVGCTYYGILLLGKNPLLSRNIRLNPNIARHWDNNRTDMLIAPIPRTSIYQNSFLVFGVAFWNSLPPIITSAAFEEFKTLCYNHLLGIEQAEVLSAYTS
uniref:Uncharacterized protein n=1 Tax=Glyptapanteles indiensis TaxID=92994 RepID=B7S8Y2_GLYIN|nr:hypothetical protein GIP_L2_0080 [Glyptapanteles indiensis]